MEFLLLEVFNIVMFAVNGFAMEYNPDEYAPEEESNIDMILGQTEENSNARAREAELNGQFGIDI